MRNSLLVFLFCMPLLSSGQQWSNTHAGIQLQFLANVGSHKTSVGVKLNTYLAIDHAQLNIGTAYRLHAAGLGRRSHFGEWRHHTGLVLMAGPENNPVNFNWGEALHQSKRPYSIGYSHLWYIDRIGTTQRSGVFNLGIGRMDVQFENDLFAGQGKDRFRTGNFYVSYRDELRSAGIGFMIWTGETRSAIWDKTPAPRSPNGYRDLSPLPYGRSSHGVLYAGAQQRFANGQVAAVQLGVDSEQIRHIFQNRLIHDVVFLPKKWVRHTPHYPRLDKNGGNVFSRKEKRPDILYFQSGVNDLFLY